MTTNAEVARLLYEIAQLLEIQGIAFKPRAYQRAARAIEALGEDINAVASSGRLRSVPGVGEAIEEKVTEFLKTGKLAYLEKLRSEMPKGLTELMRVPGLGPKTASLLEKELGIHDLKALEAAAKAGKIRTLKGFGEKSEKEILAALARVGEAPSRVAFPIAHEIAQRFIATLKVVPRVQAVEAAGSLRRGRDTVADLDILVSAPTGAASAARDAFTKFGEVAKVLESGGTRAIVLLHSGFQVDLRIVPPESFGAALQYFTGSKDHNIALRSLALRRGWTINEYALTDKKTEKRIAGATEEEIYAKLGLQWIPPELRENEGEIDLAAKKQLPDLVQQDDVLGDLHTHTDQSDGMHTLEAMATKAREIGYAYLGVSDHAKGGGAVNGMDAAAFARQRLAVSRLRKKSPDMVLLHGAEVDILKDGTLTLDRRARADLDFVIGSVHSHFGLDRAEQTRRLITAFDAGIDILGHPTTRRINQRPEIDVDWDAVYEAAKKAGVFLEIDGGPDRLDLPGEKVRRAATFGCDFVVDSDAHATGSLAWIHFGVTQARRGGLEKGRVANTWSVTKLGKRLGRSQRA